MRESCTCGSERGAPCNGRPYRERPTFHRSNMLTAPGAMPSRRRIRWNSCCSVVIWTWSTLTSRITSAAFRMRIC